jgi:hypothetical protein
MSLGLEESENFLKSGKESVKIYKPLIINDLQYSNPECNGIAPQI